MGDGLRGGDGAGAEMEVDEGVDEDGAEHADKDPKIMEVKTFGLVAAVYPALLLSSVIFSGVEQI